MAEPKKTVDTLIIYYTGTKCKQVVVPTDKFKQDWEGLANNIANGKEYTIKVV